MNPEVKGLYIAFSGVDGAGKSTQSVKLVQRLKALGKNVYLFEGRRDFVVELMRTISWRRGDNDPRVSFGNECVDFAKAFDVLRDYVLTIEPLRASGRIVIVPRSGACRVALAQAYSSKNVQDVAEVIDFAGQPDLTILLDVPAKVAVERINLRGIDEEDLSVLERLREKLVQMGETEEWVIVDGNREIEQVAEEIWSVLEDMLTRPSLR